MSQTQINEDSVMSVNLPIKDVCMVGTALMDTVRHPRNGWSKGELEVLVNICNQIADQASKNGYLETMKEVAQKKMSEEKESREKEKGNGEWAEPEPIKVDDYKRVKYADLEALQREPCHCCGKVHGAESPPELSPKCHPGNPVYVRYFDGDLFMVCASCETPIMKVGVDKSLL